jgi:hypothetical protein
MDVATTLLMQIESARAFFQTLAARAQEPRLANTVGTLELDVMGSGTWTITVDRGAVRVAEGPPPKSDIEPGTRIHVREDELVRLLRGEYHQNLVTALLRGALVIEGDLRLAQSLQAIVPVPEDWGTT